MRSLRNGFLTTLALLSVGGAAAAPASADGFVELTQNVSGPAHGDGDRWVAYAPGLVSLRVLDEAAGTSYDISIPCTPRDEVDPLLAVGGGQAVVGCAGGPTRAPRPLLLDLVARTWHEIPGIDTLMARFVGQDSDRGLWIDAVGERWIAGKVLGYRSTQEVAVDWRTGALGPRPTATTAPDLDAAGLNVPLCTPLARRPTPPSEWTAEPPFEPLAYAPPYAVGNGREAALTLQRCGSDRTTTLFPGRAGSGAAVDAQLSGGVVSWRTGRRTWLSLPTCSLRLSWTFAEDWLHTTRSLYRSLARDEGWTIERASLPTCASAARPAGARLTAGGRTVAAQTVSGRWPAAAGATVERIGVVAGRPPSLRAAPDTTISLRLATPARAVRWQVGDGAWRAARRAAGGRWTLGAPRIPRGSRPLTLHVLRDGGGVRQQVTLTR